MPVMARFQIIPTLTCHENNMDHLVYVKKLNAKSIEKKSSYI
jgi:hypothetical protein